MCKDWREPLGANSGPQLTARKETGPQSYNHKDLDSTSNQSELNTRKEHSPVNTLILPFYDSKWKTQVRLAVPGLLIHRTMRQ